MASMLLEVLCGVLTFTSAYLDHAAYSPELSSTGASEGWASILKVDTVWFPQPVLVGMAGECSLAPEGQMGCEVFGLGQIRTAAQAVGAIHQIFYGMLFFASLCTLAFHAVGMRAWYGRRELVVLRSATGAVLFLSYLMGFVTIVADIALVFVPLLENVSGVTGTQAGWGTLTDLVMTIATGVFITGWWKESSQVLSYAENGDVLGSEENATPTHDGERDLKIGVLVEV